MCVKSLSSRAPWRCFSPAGAKTTSPSASSCRSCSVFNKALALGHEQNLITAMDVHSGVGSLIEVDYVDAHLLALVRETLARNVFGTVEEFGSAAHALARYF